MSSTYPKTVKAGVKFASTDTKNKWVLADALLEEIPPSKSHANDGSHEQFEAAAVELKEAGVDLAANTLRIYRDTAKAWTDATRVASVSFSIHRVLLAESKRRSILTKLVKEGRATVAQARLAIGRKSSGHKNDLTTDERVQIAAEVLADDIESNELMQDPVTRVKARGQSARVGSAISQANREARKATGNESEVESVGEGLTGLVENMDYSSQWDHLQRDVDALVASTRDRWDRMDDELREIARLHFADLQTGVTALGIAVESIDVDAEFEKMMGGE